MDKKWTKQQQQVIDLRNRNLLVSAAAGSGKTAVLVERIIQKITDDIRPVDIDQLLIGLGAPWEKRWNDSREMFVCSVSRLYCIMRRSPPFTVFAFM